MVGRLHTFAYLGRSSSASFTASTSTKSSAATSSVQIAGSQKLPSSLSSHSAKLCGRRWKVENTVVAKVEMVGQGIVDLSFDSWPARALRPKDGQFAYLQYSRDSSNHIRLPLLILTTKKNTLGFIVKEGGSILGFARRQAAGG
ncbi:MAG: hypothetical protein R2843_11275 [Thermomicrobiales bacterium]